MAERRMFAGYYKRYDGKPIFAVRVLKDIDTGEAIVVCKDASFSRKDNEYYYLTRYTSFCEKVEVNGELRDKYVRQTRCEIGTSIVCEVYEDGFPEPKSKHFTYVDDEYTERVIRCSKTYYEYAKNLCENYRMDLRRYKLIRERKQYIGVPDRKSYQAMCEDLAFLQQSLKTVLHDYTEIFKKSFSGGLSIRKTADALQMNRGAAVCAVAGVRRASTAAGRDGRYLQLIAGNRRSLLGHNRITAAFQKCLSCRQALLFCSSCDKNMTLSIILPVGDMKDGFRSNPSERQRPASWIRDRTVTVCFILSVG